MLRKLLLKAVYESATDDLVPELISPLLAYSKDYFRGVGYFSAGWLREASRGIVAFAENGGRGRIIVSPILSEADWEAMQKGDQARFDVDLHAVLEKNIVDLETSLETDTLACLAWLIADEVLEFRFAVPRPLWRDGDYHDKVWVFTDPAGDRVALHGSFNDSVKGTLNGEAVSVFKSWDAGQLPYVELHAERLERLWRGENAQFHIRRIPDAVRERLIKLRGSEPRPYLLPDRARARTVVPEGPRVPIVVRPFQQEAIDKWKASGRRGILEMATGTGKTVTALAAAVDCYQELGRVAVVIAVPYLHLLEQWAENCREFGFEPVLCGSTQGSWRVSAGTAVRDFRLGLSNTLCLIAVHQTAASEGFARLTARIPEGFFLFVGDEVHGLGAQKLRSALPAQAEMRLGLSATPRRWLDDEGSEALSRYFGGVCFEFSLEDAIRSEFLTPYDYLPVVVALSAEEVATYQHLTLQIAQYRQGLGNALVTDERLKMLLIRRARVVWGAKAKLPKLLSILRPMILAAAEERERLRNVLVYCAPGEHAAVLRAVASTGLRCHEFVHTVAAGDRQKVLDSFEGGSIETLIAIRCLDEGVDLPATQTAFFLASTTNPRQFVQRRGRVLRRSAGKTKAQIFDFLVLPSPEVSEENRDSAISLLRREMPRFAEFSSAASNAFAARDVVFPILDAFGMLDLLDTKPWELFKELPQLDRDDEEIAG